MSFQVSRTTIELRTVSFVYTSPTMAGLKVIALISGGKDSLFSILHCVANGHDVVALGNLHPPLEDLQEDTDSYMYQTIGHSIIPLYEKALGLPLYRQAIHGTAVDQGRNYSSVKGFAGGGPDETESIVPLLRRIMAAHPDVNAVSTGAIMSDYQRTRVESVAIRLGLIPLSYLWQYPRLPPHTQTSLLEDMAVVGQDARIIKVASGGLDESFLWQNVADRRTSNRLVKASQRFGSAEDGAALGEGGEYETLAVDGPAPLWKARIEIGEEERQIVHGEAGSASIRTLAARVVPKTEDTDVRLAPRIPSLLEDRFSQLLEQVKDDHAASFNKPHSFQEAAESFTPWTCTVNVDTVHICNGIASAGHAAEQIQSIMDKFKNILDVHRHAFSDVAFVVIELKDMADFAAVNPVYGSYFSTPNPPARVTIAPSRAFPQGATVMLSATSVRKTADPRNGLHVQSRSYWAPANIGPYSQAISVVLPKQSPDAQSSHVVYVAGQIPLVPASMELVSRSAGDSGDDFTMQAVLALQHLHRIGEIMRVAFWPVIVAFVTAETPQKLSTRAWIAERVWDSFHQVATGTVSDEEEPDDFDVWHAKYGVGSGTRHTQTSEEDSSSSNVKEGTPPIHVVQVSGLPRGASIEWASIGLTSRSVSDGSAAAAAVFSWLKSLSVEA